MTDRIYYTDPYCATFEATVVASDEVDGHSHIVLDRTAFYPTSGGQPFDTGALGGVAVVEAIDREDGEVAHVASAPLQPGTVVQGVIDWPRRFDHMQQHTGQHVLSAAFDRLHAARTESFHLGAEAATIDLDREVSPYDIARAEDEANRVVWEDRPVAIRFVTPEEAASLPLRKEPGRTGRLRLIEVEHFDLSACGGTHVSRTGAIGVIAVSGWEKFRGGTRVEFLCGDRALRRFRAWRDALSATQRHLSVAPNEMASAVERLQAESKALQRTIKGLQEKLAVHEASALLAKGTLAGGRLVIAEAVEGWDAQALKTMAVVAASEQPTAAIALFTTSRPALVVIARGSAAGLDASSVLKALVSQFGGKGGGKADLAQGGGLDADTIELLEAVKHLLIA
ncbi:MAG: alanyl-tRNA editing protein [Vicinamibacterales bacterium]